MLYGYEVEGGIVVISFKYNDGRGQPTSTGGDARLYIYTLEVAKFITSARRVYIVTYRTISIWNMGIYSFKVIYIYAAQHKLAV